MTKKTLTTVAAFLTIVVLSACSSSSRDARVQAEVSGPAGPSGYTFCATLHHHQLQLLGSNGIAGGGPSPHRVGRDR
jgi:hypothetical protein